MMSWCIFWPVTNDDPGELKIDNPPAPILMVGLQGSGKTTTTAKLAKRLTEKSKASAC